MKLLAVALVALATTAGFSAADIVPCDPPSNLVAKCGSEYYDLSNMRTSSGSDTFTTSNAEYTFSVRLSNGGVDISKLTCDFPPTTTDVGAVQVRKDGGGCYSLGTASSQSWSLDTVAKTVTVKMTGGTDGRASAVEVTCDPNANTAAVTYSGQNLSGYSFTMSYKGACGSNAPPGPPPHSRKKTDVGAILVIVFFVTLILYASIGAGILYQKGERGGNLVPNRLMWIGLFALIKDGFSFLLGKIRGSGGSSTYSQI